MVLDPAAPKAGTTLRDWELLGYAGSFPLAPVTFTDHANPGVTTRVFRLRD